MAINAEGFCRYEHCDNRKEAGTTGWHRSGGSIKKLTCPTCMDIVDTMKCVPLIGSLLDVEPGKKKASEGGVEAIRCQKEECPEIVCYLNAQYPMATGWRKRSSGWICLTCQVAEQNAVEGHCRFETCERPKLASDIGWKGSSTKLLTCPTCSDAREWERKMVPFPECMEHVEPGQKITSDGGLCSVRCHWQSCLRAECYMDASHPAINGWKKFGGDWTCLVHKEREQTEPEFPAALPFDGRLGETSLGLVARHVVMLTRRLNEAMVRSGGSMPAWLLEPSDINLRIAGRYNPDEGRGLPWEPDHGNMAGSALILAMLVPFVFGVPNAPYLKIFGDPPPRSMVFISDKRATSSVGADNRRTNAIEGLLNDWQEDEDPFIQEVRAELLRCWFMMRLAVTHVDVQKKLRVHEVTRPCLQVPDEVVEDVLAVEGLVWV